VPIELLSIRGLWPIAEKIPAVAAFFGQWYFTSERLAQLVYVDLFPRHESARIDVGPAASFQLHLQVINLSPFELELDRANFHLWCGGVRLDASILQKESIPAGKSASLFVSAAIVDGHANQLLKNYENNQVTLDGNIEFNCRVRSFAKNIGQLSGIQAKVVNVQSRKADA
jgi:hypothetical protein